MTFAEPIPFAEALQALADKDLLPTGLSTAELRDLPADIRDVSIFSARMNNAGAVQRFRDLVGQLLSPANRAPGEGINLATARARMQDFLREEGYDSERGGFADAAKAPFAEHGSLRDLSSNPRLELMLKTKVQQMAQSGYKIQQNTPAARRMYPCWELVRVGVLKHADAARDWPRRWAKVGGQFYGGRMIAPKDADLWAALGSSENFDDALDTEIPPYAFNSHMTRRAVARAVCVELGAIAADFVPAAQGVQIKAAAQASALPFDRDFLTALRKDLGAEVEAGRIRLAANSGAGVIEALAGWLTGRVLAWNDGTSEGARKGWITRRMGQRERTLRSSAPPPASYEMDAYREHQVEGAERASEGAAYRNRFPESDAFDIDAGRLRGMSHSDFQADAFHGRRLRDFAFNQRDHVNDMDPAQVKKNARAVAEAAIQAHRPAVRLSPSTDPAQVARSVDPQMTATVTPGMHGSAIKFALGQDELRVRQTAARTSADATDAGAHGGGSALYAAAYAHANNVGSRYEAHGLTKENQIRSTANQITSILDHGGYTGHLLPESHSQGIAGWNDQAATTAEHRENLGAALLREKEHAFASHPMLRRYRIDKANRITDLDGNKVSEDILKHDIRGTDPKAKRFKVGINTAIRAIRTNTVLRRREAGEK